MPPFQEQPPTRQETIVSSLIKKALEKLENVEKLKKENNETLTRDDIEKEVISVMNEEKIMEREGGNIFIALKNSVVGKILNRQNTASIKATVPQQEKASPETKPQKYYWQKDDEKPEIKRNPDGSWSEVPKEN